MDRLRDESGVGMLRGGPPAVRPLGPRPRRGDAEWEHPGLSIERMRFVLLLKEELAYESMTEEQRAADRLEDQIVSWMSHAEDLDSTVDPAG